jgi:hypothetical protein
VFLQAGDGHGHLDRQALFLLLPASREAANSRDLPQEASRFAAASEKVAHTVTGLEVLVFEPSML